MWDYLGTDENGKVDTVYEMKTTKRIEDWKDDVPEYYALQASLYAYLLGVDNVVMVASFLEENNYNNPEAYHPTVNNTITKEFKVSERYPDFEEKVKKVIKWWDAHVVTGVSPDYNEQKDVEILKNLRTSSLSPDTDIKSLMVEGESLKEEIDTVTNSIADKTKRLKKINELIKEYAISQFKDGDKKAEIQGSKYTWTVTKTVTNTVNKDALEANGVLDKYMTQNETFKITVR